MKYASPRSRIFAKFIDFMIVIFLGLIWRGGPGSLLGFLYSIAGDALPWKKHKGQSIGKRIMNIHVYHGQHGPGNLRTSVIRNIPVGVVTFLMIIPFWGWILSLLIGVPLMLIEISLIIRAERHQRLGDVMAESVVLVKNSV